MIQMALLLLLKALGFAALTGVGGPVTGSNNTAVGAAAMYSNLSGYQNNATGYYALRQNTTGYNNTADGFVAMQFNTTGGNNTALGLGTLWTNTGKVGSTAVGYLAMVNADSSTSNTDTWNTAVGEYALYGSASRGQ